MTITFVPETEVEKKAFEMVMTDDEKKFSIEERVCFLERHAKAVSLNALSTHKAIEQIKEMILEDDDEEDEDWQKMIDDISSLQKQMNLFHQSVLELEEYKVRLRNAEYDLRQALSKISGLEQSNEMSRQCINGHSDDIDRLVLAVFDEKRPVPEEEEG